MRYRFDAFTLDIERRELRSAGAGVEVEPQVFDLLAFLVRERDRVVSKDDILEAVWRGRIISESTLTSRINAARRAIGDSGEAQKLIRTLPRKGFRFVAAVTEEAGSVLAGDGVAEAPPGAAAPARQEVLFCTTTDGVQIAYAEVGKGPPLVKAANWLNHLEFDWQSPVWSPLLHTLSAGRRLIRYDARGNGLSDWDVADISFEAFVRDLDSVVDAARLERFPLLGLSQGCAISIAYAVRNPERVSHLILYGGFVRGRRRRGPEGVQQSDALLTLMRQGWGQDNPAFRQIFTSLFVPDGTPEQVRSFNELQRVTTSPENAVRIRAAVDNIDITDLLGRVRVPALVLHCREDAVHPFDEGRRLAAAIPGARFVALEGRNHVLLDTDPAWQRVLEEIEVFLCP